MELDDLAHKYLASANEDLELFGDNYPAELATSTLDYLKTLLQKTESKMQNDFK